MEPNRRRRLSADDWRAALERFEESGLSVREFCESEGLGAASFYRWRTRLSSRAPRTSAVNAARTSAASGFVELGTLPAQGTRFEVRLELGGGVLLHLVRG
jgi:transposase-like protein